MRYGFVNLYQIFGRKRDPGAEGDLTWWVPETPAGVGEGRRRPAVLILPGGGYSRTSRREGEPVALRFVARGWGAFVLSYSCAPLTFPVSLREAAMAMEYIRGQADDLGVDPHMVAAMGFSAGGHLCGTLGTLWDAPEVGDVAPPDRLRPDALGLCYPVAVSWGRTHRESFQNLTGGDGALEARLSLDRLVRGDMPPVFLWHTGDDRSVPCRNSLLLAQALEEKGVEFALHIYRHGCHGLSTADEQVYPVGGVPGMSRDVPGWPEALLEFWAEVGLRLREGGKA